MNSSAVAGPPITSQTPHRGRTMRWVSNLPPEGKTPFPVVAEEPDPIVVVRYFRPSDYAAWGAFTVGFPAAFVVWERLRPSGHPRYVGRGALVQMPVFFGLGFFFSFTNSIARFWGWSENKRERERYREESDKGALVPAWWTWR
ncbi:NADH-ubiquinone oxidoreductase complex I, 21 kDa subunit-domain-containing protein [Hyaloraphidium curvatum]|nr:NADH-ubiquinone oxidoreductase complex I, 21 kDa subunit-domain-containing protein [Hyaloraphidium curvatum]